MKKTKAAILLLTITCIYLITPGYVKQTIIHLFPGIEDYQFFENREVATGIVQPWATAHDYMRHSLTQQERDTLEHYESVAYLIIQNDSVVYEEYWDGFNQNSLSNSFSAAKSVIGLLIGAAIQDGYISNIDQSVSDFIPQFADSSYHKLHIRDLLTMSSGLNWNESYINPFSMTTEAYYGDNINQLVLDLKLIETPGIEFKYLSGNTQLLSIILKNATGKPLAQYASEKIWKPLGAVNPALWSLDKADGNEKAYCCLNSNARDFAKIGKIILDKGNINGKQLFPATYIENMIKPAQHLQHFKTKEAVDFYGYQWWIIHNNGREIPYARGILGQYIFVLPEQNAIVVRLGYKRSKDKPHHHPSETYTYLDIANRILQVRN